MKPLPSAPLTFEDVGIWILACHRFCPSAAVALLIGGAAIDADRRDAELMLQLAKVAHAAMRPAVSIAMDGSIAGSDPVAVIE